LRQAAGVFVVGGEDTAASPVLRKVSFQEEIMLHQVLNVVFMSERG